MRASIQIVSLNRKFYCAQFLPLETKSKYGRKRQFRKSHIIFVVIYDLIYKFLHQTNACNTKVLTAIPSCNYTSYIFMAAFLALVDFLPHQTPNHPWIHQSAYHSCPESGTLKCDGVRVHASVESTPFCKNCEIHHRF